MAWFPVALAVALLAATEAALAKRLFGDLPPLQMAAAPLFYAAPLFLLLLPLALSRPAPDPAFWSTYLWLLPLNAAGFLCHMAAVNLAPISLVMPYLSFTPVFVLLTGFLILGETASWAGVGGVLLVVLGSWVLNAAEARKGPLAPLKALWRQPGARLMLAASLLYSLCAVLGKKLILHSDPVFTAVFFFLGFGGLTLVGLRLTGRIRFAPLLARPRAGAALGLTVAVHVFCHLWAISLVQAAYMISVKRLSGLFSVIYGGLLFREKNLSLRMAGAFFMFLGALAITLGG
ncbi:DMT family transporter [Desulfohalovibrio reitneri]|uniref:DMT family transporter n=1 Tax=Desulfohalovibrio reitneri TaxID=1307759 RepID=UPI0004A73C42|nr:DMT family transporter [Desulfohalovibrio reitneri]